MKETTHSHLEALRTRAARRQPPELMDTLAGILLIIAVLAVADALTLSFVGT